MNISSHAGKEKEMVRKLLLCTMVVMLTASVVCAGVNELEAVKQRAIAAAKLISAEGDAALAKLKDPAGEFNKGQEYVWVNNLDGVCVFHPIKPVLIGQNLLEQKDANGVYMFVAFNEMAQKHGAGWVTYVWPKPGEQASAPKTSYVVLLKDKKYVVGCGTYDVTAADIKAKFPGDHVDDM
jgi:cytochrome c